MILSQLADTSISLECSIDMLIGSDVYWDVITGETKRSPAYEACDRTRTPLHTPKTLETCKEKHPLFD